MSHDLEKIARVVREEEARGERLDELGKAAVSGADTSALERELGVNAASARAAYEPLSPEVMARATERIAALVRTAPSKPPSKAPSAPRGHLVRWLAVPALAAALAGLWVGVRPPDPALLPGYRLELEGISSERATPAPRAGAQPVELAAGSGVKLGLRPERDVRGELALRVYIRSQRGLESIEHSIETAPNGARRVRIPARVELPVTGTLVVWVGRPETFDAAQLAAGSAAMGPGWQRLEQSFRLAHIQ